MKRLIFFGIFFYWTACAIAQNTLTIIIVSPDVSPFLSDWKEDPNMVFIRVDNVGGTEIPRALLSVTISGIKMGEVASFKSKEFVIPANGSVTLYGNDKLIDVKTVSFKADIEKKVAASNRIPDDHYDICTDVLDLSDDKILSTTCAQFDIRAASAPVLLQPIDADVVTTKYPLFQWVPTRTTNRMEVLYTLRVFPLREFQTPVQSIESGTVRVFEKSDISVPSAIMTTEAIELEDGQTYVWQVQAHDRNREPIGENSGKSEVFQFMYLSPESFHRMQQQKDSLNALPDSTLKK